MAVAHPYVAACSLIRSSTTNAATATAKAEIGRARGWRLRDRLPPVRPPVREKRRWSFRRPGAGAGAGASGGAQGQGPLASSSSHCFSEAEVHVVVVAQEQNQQQQVLHRVAAAAAVVPEAMLCIHAILPQKYTETSIFVPS